MCSILVANKSVRKQLVQWGRRGKGGESDLLYLCSAVVNLTARDIFLSFFYIEIWAGGSVSCRDARIYLWNWGFGFLSSRPEPISGWIKFFFLLFWNVHKSINMEKVPILGCRTTFSFASSNLLRFSSPYLLEHDLYFGKLNCILATLKVFPSYFFINPISCWSCPKQ